ncbi:MAG: hypothetical protein WCH61_09840, partial [bacterium]
NKNEPIKYTITLPEKFKLVKLEIKSTEHDKIPHDKDINVISNDNNGKMTITIKQDKIKIIMKKYRTAIANLTNVTLNLSTTRDQDNAQFATIIAQWKP